MEIGRIGTHRMNSDTEKIMQLRQKIRDVFECECLLDDATMAERYNLTNDGDLVMILK